MAEWRHIGWLSELQAPPWAVHVTETYFAFILHDRDGKECSRPIQCWSLRGKHTLVTPAREVGRQLLAYAESLPEWPILDLINR